MISPEESVRQGWLWLIGATVLLLYIVSFSIYVLLQVGQTKSALNIMVKMFSFGSIIVVIGFMYAGILFLHALIIYTFRWYKNYRGDND